ncbi:MAG: glucose-6-phosphate isomerase, partial [Chloroflexi bacterium]|nr:glucose-6-phosphate isomerase [Chloroflexota bacterium]
RLVEQAVGKEQAGQNFIAVTDPGTSLDKLGREQGFRRVFLNPPNIGGRYSVLSYFGLVPAALIGLDLATLLDRADCMREGCASCVPAHDNPGAWLGAAMGVLARQGRNKLTLVTSPSISSFGLWVEQLIAESTGKEGKGIVPVAGEPLLEPAAYGNDRFFVYLRLDGDDNADLDQAMQRLQSSGQPVLRWALKDRYDLGAEFFRWEFANAVAGAILGIQPFDQPNVQQAKDLTAQVLASYEKEGRLPDVSATGSLRELLSGAKPGDYLAIMAYVQETPAVVARLTDLRRAVMQRHGIATTLGFGPRFLHSTGQLHKGGPPTGLYLQIVTDDAHDLPVPGETYSFGVLAAAQALGDLNALEALGRRVARVTLKGDVETSLASMAIE